MTLTLITYTVLAFYYITSVTHLKYLVGCICLVVIEESVVGYMACPLPGKRQLHHLSWWCGDPLCEALQGNILQQSDVTNSTEQVNLKDLKV